VFTIEVPVMTTDYWLDGEWVETLDSQQQRKIDKAIEKEYPHWFHTCYESPKQHCQACVRDKYIRLTETKDLVK